MSAIAWRGVITALKAEIVEARRARREAESQLENAKARAQRCAKAIEHSEIVGEAKAREVAVNHFTDQFREAMRRR